MAGKPRRRQPLSSAAVCWTLMLCGAVSGISAYDQTGIYACETRVGIRKSVLVFRAGSPAKVCCTAERTLCDPDATTGFSNDTLTLLPRWASTGLQEADALESPEGSTMQQVDACTVEFTWDKPPAGQVQFTCRWKGQLIQARNAVFVAKPETPAITNIMCTPRKSITVWFDRGPVDTQARDKYQVKMVESFDDQRTVTLCEWDSAKEQDSNSPEVRCSPGSRMCVCQYKEQRPVHSERMVTVHNVTLTVAVSRPLWTVETSRVVKLFNHLRPGPIKQFPVELDSPYHGSAKICLRAETKRISAYMSAHGDPLRCRIALNRTQGSVKVVTMEIKDLTKNQPCVKVIFSNLTAFTLYTLTVSGIGGGGEGQRRTTEFTTAKTAPLRPPAVNDFSFSRRYQVDAENQPLSTLVVLWQPLPHQYSGGANVTYNLEVWSGNGLELSHTGIASTFKVLTEPLPPSALTVRLWAQNELGRSDTFSAIEIPAVRDIKPVPFRVEFAQNQMHVHIEKSAVAGDGRQMLIHLCKAHTRLRDMDVCTDYPVTRTLNSELAVPSPGGASESYTLDMDLEANYHAVPGKKQVDFSVLKYKNDQRGIDKTVLADVETWVQTKSSWYGSGEEGPLDTEDYDDPDSMESSGDGPWVGDDEQGGSEENEESSSINLPSSSSSSKKTLHSATNDNIMKRSLRGFAYKNSRRVLKRSVGQTLKSASVDDISVQQQQQQQQKGLRHLLSLPDPASRSRREHSSGQAGAPNPFSDPEDSAAAAAATSPQTTVLPDPSRISTDHPAALPSRDGADHYRVFLSFRGEDGTTSGMLSAQCYFREASDNVELILSQGNHSGDGYPLLRWTQVCDSSPRQFLADSYQVFVSMDELCRDNVKHVKDVENQVFGSSVVELPKDWPFACVRSHRRQSRSSPIFTSQPSVKSIEPPMSESWISYRQLKQLFEHSHRHCLCLDDFTTVSELMDAIKADL